MLLVMLTWVTVNMNGLHKLDKWQAFWNEVPYIDVICVQETHLTWAQEFAFGLHAQSYEFFYSHGTSASVGVFTAVKRNRGIKVSPVAEVQGRLLALDLCHPQISCHLINIYAPNEPALHGTFFNSMPQWIMNKTVLLGDFNSVTQKCDRF